MAPDSYQFISVRNWPLQLPVHVLLKLLHVEHLERFVRLENAVGHLQQDVVGDCALLGDVPDSDGCRSAQPFDLKKYFFNEQCTLNSSDNILQRAALRM
jgi:hypothetical protein